jgi:hypothetical protein
MEIQLIFSDWENAGRGSFNGIKNGSVNGKNASMINVPLVDGSMVIEVNDSGLKTVKTGDFETMVSLKEEKQLKESRVTMSKDPGSIKFLFLRSTCNR